MISTTTNCGNKTTKLANKILAILGVFMLCSSLSWAQLLQQDFTASTTVSTYVNATTPNNGQFNAIGTSGGGVVLSINTTTSNKLRYAYTGANAGSYSRSSNFSGPPTTLMYRFDFTVSGNSVASTSLGTFQVGSSYGTANAAESNANTYARFGINTTATAGQFSIRDITNGTSSANFTGIQTLTWVLNNSGASTTYRAPDNSNRTIANDRADLWVGSTNALNGVTIQTASQNINNLKFVITGGSTATFDFDNFLVDPIPGIPTSSAATSITSSSFTANWSTVAGVTGYRIDVATDAGFTSMVSGYNNLYVSGQATSSLVVNTGLSASTPYYYRVRAASQYTIGEFAGGNSSTQNPTTLSSSPTINGTIGAGEYGTHTNGSNQQSSTTGTWYMTWDATNLYIAIAGTNTAEGAVLYLDKNPVTPVNGGANSDGSLVGNNYDGSSFANLQFRADLVLYFKDGYHEYRTSDGSGGWTSQTANANTYSSASGNREFSIPWSVIGGQPSAFNWFGYVAYTGGGAYASVPTENPGSGAGTVIGSSARWDRYYTVSTTSTLPFSRNSYTFTSASDVTSFGPITAYDYTMNSSGRFVSRTGNTAGNWVIGGNITVGAGTIYLGSGGGSYGTTAVTGNLNLLGGTFDMDQTTGAVTVSGNVSVSSGATLKLSGTAGGDLNVAGNWSNAGTFTPSTRQVVFNGGAAQTLTGSTTFDYLKLNNTNGLTLQSSSPVTVNTNFDLTLGKLTLGANNLTMGSSASFSNQSATSYIVTNSTGALVRNSVGNTATPFPAGLAGSYTPLTVTNTGTTNNLSLVVTSPPANTVTDATKIVNLEWNLNSGGSGAVGTVVFNWNTPSNVGGSYNASGTGELGNYTSGPNYAITSIGSMSGTSKSVSGIALSSGANKLVLGNSNAVYAVPPSNNDCSAATSITIGNSPITGDVLNATQSLAAITCTLTGNANDDVWYQFTTTIAGNYVITVVGASGFDAVVDLRSGACNGTNIACADATAGGGTETITFGLSATTTYYVRVYDYGAGYPTNSTFTIAVAAPSPSLTATVSSLSFGNQAIQVASAFQTFNINATALSPASGNITVNAPNSDWLVSSDDITYGASALVAYTGNTITNAPVYVKFIPQTAGAKSGINVTFTGGSVGTPPTIALTGTGTVPAPTVGAATNVACTSFDANWSAVTGATSYRLDVSTNAAFSTPTTITSEAFENTLTLFTASGTGSYATGNSASGDRPATSPFASAGTYSFGVNNGTATLTSSAINTSAYSNNQLSFRLASFSIASAGNGADAGDIVTVEISPNGGTNYYSTARVLGNSNAYWDYTATGSASTAYDGDATPVDFSPAGGGSRTTDGYSTVTITGLPAVSNLIVRITLLNNAGGERWAIDQLAINGDLGLYVTGYQDLNVGNVITYPVNTNLTANTTYYYRVRAVNNSIASSNSSNATLTTTSGTWTGAVNTDWVNSGNWCGGGVPTSSTDVIIPNSLSNYPIVTTGTQAVKSITIASSATLQINGGSLTMAGAGDIINSGALTVGPSGTLNMVNNLVSGTGTVTVNGTLSTQNSVGLSGGASTTIVNTVSSLTLGSASTIDYAAVGPQDITAGNYANLTNSGNGDRTFANSGTIGIGATFSPGTGAYTVSGSTVSFNGTSSQTIPAHLPDSKYDNLTINNSSGVSMSADLAIEGALTLTSGTFTTTGYDFTLLSTSSKTGRIAPVTGGTITGDIIMQRFVPGGVAGWATICAPVSGATLAQWNDDIATSGFTGSTYGAGIFNSIYTYDETIPGLSSVSNAYIQATNVTNSIDPIKGYYVFIDMASPTVADKLLDVKGPPLVGSQDLNVTYTSSGGGVDEDGWNLVANPYASAINWNAGAWTKTNMDNSFYIYEANSAQYKGISGGVSYNGGGATIASSQAFLVHANAASPSLIADENIKVASNPTFYKESNVGTGILRLQLDGLNGTYFDETVFHTDINATSNFDPAFDGYKLYSFDPAAPNISSKLNGIEYVVNTVGDLNTNLDLPVRVNVNTPGSYTINFIGLQEFANVTCFSLEDKLTNTWVDLHIDSTYTFSSAIDTVKSYARFVLHFGVESIVPQISPSATTVSIPGSTSVDFTNLTTGANSYSWDFGDGSPVENTVNPSHTYSAVGVYTVTLTASNTAGCSQTSTVLITVEDVTGINSVAAEESILIGKDAQGVYANYNFKNSTLVKLSIYNALGEQIGLTKTKTVQSKGQFYVETSGLAKGVYTIELLVNNKKITRKVML